MMPQDISIFQRLVGKSCCERIYEYSNESPAETQMPRCRSTAALLLENSCSKAVPPKLTRNEILNNESIDPEQERFFILDDTTLEKSGICMEGISRVFEHVKQRSILGNKLLLLAITDTKSTLPLDFSLHAESGRKNNFGLTKKQLKEEVHQTTRLG